MASAVVGIGVLWLLVPVAGDCQEKKEGVPHRVIRVTAPDSQNAVEASVAINPTNPDHIVAVSMKAGKKGQPRTTNFAYVSTDAGRTWKTVAQANPHQRVQGDDVVTFTADGLAVRAYISFDGIRLKRPKHASSGIITSTSRDGLTWSVPVPVVDHVNTCIPMEDKPWVKADTVKGSPHRGNLYIAWTKFDEYGSKAPEDKSHIYFSRSLDNGKTFAVPLRISEVAGDCLDSNKSVMGATPAVGPKGEVYVVWGGPNGIVVAKSTDGGNTFGKNKVIATTSGWDFAIKGLKRCDGLPSCGVDLSAGKDRGTIYATWADTRNGDPDVFLCASRDGGATWSKPMRVNDDAFKNGKDQFFPWMAVDPQDGSVNIVFYDRRSCEGAKTGLTLARSVDGGRTFVNHKINQEPFTCDESGFFGDYLGVDAFGGRVVAVYMHYLMPKKLGLSAAVFEFEPGTQQPRKEKRAGGGGSVGGRPNGVARLDRADAVGIAGACDEQPEHIAADKQLRITCLTALEKSRNLQVWVVPQPR